MARSMHVEPADIIDAAKQSIEKRGLAATTLKSVAAEAGVTQGMVYYHFKTKEELLFAVLQSSVFELRDLVVKAWSSAGDPESRVTSAFDICRDMFGKRDDLHRLLIDVAAYSLQNEQAAIEFGQLMQTALQAIKHNCQDVYESEPRELSCLPPPEPLSRIIFSLMIGMALQSLFNKEIAVGEVYDTLKQMILDMMQHRQGNGSRSKVQG